MLSSSEGRSRSAPNEPTVVAFLCNWCSYRAADLADRFLERKGRGRVVGLALERAGIDLRPAEFVVLVAVVAIGAFMVGALFGNLFLAIILPIIVVLGFFLFQSFFGGVLFFTPLRSASK